MTQNAAELYTLSGATGEIFIMLLVSFVLGALLGRLLGSQDGATAPIAMPAPKQPPLLSAGKPEAVKRDDLKIVEGIGPRIEELLNQNGILTWKMLSQTPVERLSRILEGGNGHFKMHDPKTWPDQAALAANARWEELKKFQDLLNGGRV